MFSCDRRSGTKWERLVGAWSVIAAAMIGLVGVSCAPAPAEDAPTAALHAATLVASADAPAAGLGLRGRIEMPLVPDEEAASLPTFNGVPLVPLTAPVPALRRREVEAWVRSHPDLHVTNDIAVELIKEEEALRLEAYELGGLWLIGYGHLMLDGEKDVITEEEAEAFLRADLEWCEGAVQRMVDVYVTNNEFSAVSAFCYNVGSGKTRGSSIVRKLNDGDRHGAADAFLLWNRMNGEVMSALANRRARERTLFLAP